MAECNLGSPESLEVTKNSEVSDFRLADFKFFLPLGSRVRVLVTQDMPYREFLPHLLQDVESIELFQEDSQRILDPMAESLSLSGHLRQVSQVSGTYDLIFANSTEVIQHLKSGGIFCTFDEKTALNGELRNMSSGHWIAYPNWPSFRFLIPNTSVARTVTTHYLNIPIQGRWTSWLLPTSQGLGTQPALHIFRAEGQEATPPFYEQIISALAGNAEVSQLQETAPEQWVVYSGQQGEGNPIIAMVLDKSGIPGFVIKSSRFPHQKHLNAEVEKVKMVLERLGPTLSSYVIAPVGHAEVPGHPILVYRFEPTCHINKIAWHLYVRRNFLFTITDWLTEIVRQTAQSISVSLFQQKQIMPLIRLLARDVLPPDLVEPANQAVHFLNLMKDNPYSILEHGDFGIHNVRLSTQDGTDFKVLDWGSSEQWGIPLGDLCTMLVSTRAPSSIAVRCLSTYLHDVGDPQQGLYFWLSYMARRWEELESVRPSVAGDPTSGAGILLHQTRMLQSWLAKL